MIWEGVSTDSATKYFGIIWILFYGTKIEHPIVISVATFEELDHVSSVIAIEGFDSRGRVTHDDNLVGDIDKIFQNIYIYCERAGKKG